MLKLTSETMAKAIENAKATRSHVRVVDASKRTYAVSGSKGGEYTVRFVVSGRDKFGECSCRASEFNKLCRHIAAAASLNIAIQSQREANPTVGDMLAFESRYGSGWNI